MPEEPDDELADQVGAHGPGRAKVAEDIGHVGHVREHDATVRPALRVVERLAVDREVDVAQHIHVEAGGGDDDVGVQMVA